MATSPIYSWPEPDNTDLVKNGALAIRTMGNAIDTTMGTMTPKSTYTAKGSIAAATAASTPANLAVGNNGETLVADSSTSTGLRYQSNFSAGKNAVINGDLGVWQRGTSFSVAGTSYTADRFRVVAAGATVTRQNFTAGTAPVAGYEGQYYFNQLNTANNQNYDTSIRLENARTFAGQTVTLSFWARSTAGAQPLNVAIYQSFGTGGSPSSDVAATYVSGSGSPYTPTSSWVRYTFTYTMPSVAGKTFGTNNDSYLILRLFQYTTTATNTSIDIWGVQLEAGSVATAFQTATGTIQGELAACQRYYWRWNAATQFATCGVGTATSSTIAAITCYHPVPMRTTISSIDGSANSTLRLHDWATGYTQTVVSIEVSALDLLKSTLNITVASGLTQYRIYNYGANNSTSAFIGFNAEL